MPKQVFVINRRIHESSVTQKAHVFVVSSMYSVAFVSTRGGLKCFGTKFTLVQFLALYRQISSQMMHLKFTTSSCNFLQYENTNVSFCVHHCPAFPKSLHNGKLLPLNGQPHCTIQCMQIYNFSFRFCCPNDTN